MNRVAQSGVKNHKKESETPENTGSLYDSEREGKKLFYPLDDARNRHHMEA